MIILYIEKVSKILLTLRAFRTISPAGLKTSWRASVLIEVQIFATAAAPSWTGCWMFTLHRCVQILNGISEHVGVLMLHHLGNIYILYWFLLTTWKSLWPSTSTLSWLAERGVLSAAGAPNSMGSGRSSSSSPLKAGWLAGPVATGDAFVQNRANVLLTCYSWC